MGPAGRLSAMGPAGRLGMLWAQREGWECYGPSGKAGNAMGPAGRLGTYSSV